jgi:hypothetical protein
MKVIKRSNIPTRLPVWQSLITILSLDYWKAPDWIYVIFAIFFIILWTSSIIMIIKEKQVDIFKNKNQKP